MAVALEIATLIGSSWSEIDSSTSGAGGSSFVSGYTGCDAIDKDSTESNIIHTGSPVHSSGMHFISPQMIAGNATMPSYSTNGTMVGNAGDGYARIAFLGGSLSED